MFVQSILETLKIEGKAMHVLHSLGIKEDFPSKFMRLASQSQDASYALDIRHSAIVVSDIFVHMTL